jgi:hypothetical protein
MRVVFAAAVAGRARPSRASAEMARVLILIFWVLPFLPG